MCSLSITIFIFYCDVDDGIIKSKRGKKFPRWTKESKMLGGKGLFDRVDVLRCVWGVKQTRDHVLATIEMIINISDFNETNFTKDEKLLCLVFSVRRTTSNVKFPLFFAS